MSKRHAVSRNSARRVFDRLPSWAKPRIGLLEHHEPRPLRVPARYLRLGAPEPAPTITIVTPSYQQGRFLDRTIYSVVSQKYPGLEYVVQDAKVMIVDENTGRVMPGAALSICRPNQFDNTPLTET